LTFQSCQITPKEWRWVIAWSIAMLILSCIPYAIAASTAPEGWQFAGVLVNPSDAHTYLAKMRQGLEGSWLFHLTYTPEHHEPVFLYTFYLALGHLAALTQLPLVLIFHLARLAAGFWLLLTAFRFIAHVTPRLAERQLAFVLLASTAGFGWLKAADLDISPIDAWVPEAFVPHMLYANPHFPLATALMLTITQRIVWPSRNKLSALWVGIAATSLTITQPLATITTTVVLMLFLAWRFVAHRSVPWPQIRLTLSAILFSAPVVLYDYWITKTNPVIAGWNAQNITPAPALTDLALGYGLTGLLAVVGGWMLARRSIQDANDGEWLILLWAIATIGLVYLPFALQRRFIHGLHIPLGILAAMGLRHRRQLAGVVVATGMSGMLFVWSIPLLAALQSPAQSENAAILFMRHEEMAAFEWLNQNSAADDVVLASPRVGMFIPSQTKSRPFYGHVFETIDARTKIAMLAAFYRGDIDAVSPRPEFIFYGPSERVLGQPEKLSDLPVRFSTGNVQIYEMPDDE
jgi:hypothetical protein